MKALIGKVIRDKRGTSIIVVTIVMAVIAFVCLSLLLISYQMISASSDDKVSDKYYRQTESFSKVLKMRLNSGKPGAKNSMESFIYEFMSDDKNYPATMETSSNAEFDADSPTGDGGEKYSAINIKLKKELASGSNDAGSEDDNNGWSERREYYCTIKVSAVSGEEKLSTITQRHLFYLAATSYNYYSENSEGEITTYKLDPEDENMLVVKSGDKEAKVSLNSLMNNKGLFSEEGFPNLTIKRSLNKNNTTYKFDFLGWS